jgi:hypothetical protein
MPENLYHARFIGVMTLREAGCIRGFLFNAKSATFATGFVHKAQSRGERGALGVKKMHTFPLFRHCPIYSGNPFNRMDHPDEPGDDEVGAWSMRQQSN